MRHPIVQRIQRVDSWLGRLDSNQGMAESKSAALPLGYAPTRWLAPRIAAVSAEFNEPLRPGGGSPTLMWPFAIVIAREGGRSSTPRAASSGTALLRPTPLR